MIHVARRKNKQTNEGKGETRGETKARRKTSYVQVFARVSQSYVAYIKLTASRCAAKEEKLSPKIEDKDSSERNRTSKRKKDSR